METRFQHLIGLGCIALGVYAATVAWGFGVLIAVTGMALVYGSLASRWLDRDWEPPASVSGIGCLERLQIALQRAEGLRRFKRAQDPVWETVQAELRDGRKQTHWMWFVAPQPLGLGQSHRSRVYGLTQREARRYVRDPVLCHRLHLVAYHVLGLVQYGWSLEDIFGELDAQKFRSCLRLFAPYDRWMSSVWAQIVKLEREAEDVQASR